MDMELAMRLSCVTLYHLPCVPWVRRGDRRGEERRRWGGTDEKESGGDTHPAASDLQVPKGHESDFKNKLEGLCDLGSRAAEGIF